eukprot:465511-Prymnesium_polylepis.1
MGSPLTLNLTRARIRLLLLVPPTLIVSEPPCTVEACFAYTHVESLALKVWLVHGGRVTSSTPSMKTNVALSGGTGSVKLAPSPASDAVPFVSPFAPGEGPAH